MSSTINSCPDFGSILEAAFDGYTRLTGIDLTTHPSAQRLQTCHSPEAVLQLLQEREASFKDRDGHRRLTNWLLPVVRVVHAFSSPLVEVGGLLVVSPRGPNPHLYSYTYESSPRRPCNSHGQSLLASTFSSWCVASLPNLVQIVVIPSHPRPLLASPQAMARSSISSNASAASSLAYLFIRKRSSSPLRWHM